MYVRTYQKRLVPVMDFTGDKAEMHPRARNTPWTSKNPSGRAGTLTGMCLKGGAATSSIPCLLSGPKGVVPSRLEVPLHQKVGNVLSTSEGATPLQMLKGILIQTSEGQTTTKDATPLLGAHTSSTGTHLVYQNLNHHLDDTHLLDILPGAKLPGTNNHHHCTCK